MAMKSTVRVELECDHKPGLCLRQPVVIGRPTHFDAINEARRLGWYIAGKFALCPEHAVARNSENPASLRVSR